MLCAALTPSENVEKVGMSIAAVLQRAQASGLWGAQVMSQDETRHQSMAAA